MKVREGYIPEQVSKKNYELILEELNQRQREVFDAIKALKRCTNEQIAAKLGIFPHVVTPRTLELRNLGLVELAYEGKSASNRPVCYWKLKEKTYQPELF